MKNLINFIRTGFVILFLVLSIGMSVVQAQDDLIPVNYQLEVVSDYAPYTAYVQRSIQWLEAQPLQEEVAKRQAVTAFVYRWLSGSPTVNLNIQAEVSGDLLKEATFPYGQDFLMAYIFGMGLYQIENPELPGQLETQVAGIRHMLSYYKKLEKEDRKKSKFLKKLNKLNRKGKLEHWLQLKLGIE